MFGSRATEAIWQGFSAHALLSGPAAYLSRSRGTVSCPPAGRNTFCSPQSPLLHIFTQGSCTLFSNTVINPNVC